MTISRFTIGLHLNQTSNFFSCINEHPAENCINMDRVKGNHHFIHSSKTLLAEVSLLRVIVTLYTVFL